MGALMAEIDEIGRDIARLNTEVRRNDGETAAVSDLTYDLSELMSELEAIRTSPEPTSQKEEKIKKRIRKLREDVEGTRRSSRLAAITATRSAAKNVNMGSAAASNNRYNRGRITARNRNRGTRSRNINRRGNTRSSNKPRRYSRSPLRRVSNIQRNNRPSNPPVRRLKSVVAKASEIISKKDIPIIPASNSTTLRLQISGYEGRLKELIDNIPMNNMNGTIRQAIDILQAKMSAAFGRTNSSLSASSTAATMPVMMPQSSGKPMSEILTGKAKGKSLYAQALTILEAPQKITESRFIPYLKDQHDTFDEFIRTHRENAHINEIMRAKNILLSNPQVYDLINPGAVMGPMNNNNNL